MTITEYCALSLQAGKKVSTAYIRRLVTKDQKVPGIVSHTKLGKTHILKVRLTADGELLIKEAAAKEKIKLPKG